MDADELVRRARDAKESFGIKCGKFAGAVTVEILKEALAIEGIPTSQRDVFIRGIPVEIDLVIPREGQRPRWGLVYDPSQVAAVLEVKNSGSFGPKTLATTTRHFALFREANVAYAYVTFEERRRYKWAATTQRDGPPCFTLAWHSANRKTIEVTTEWADVLTFLRQCIDQPS